MRTKIFIAFILSLMLTVGVSGCSKDDFNPEDTVTSILSGEYKNGGYWKLHVTVNGSPIENYEYVRFDSKDLKTGDFKFVNVIPGVSEKKFKDIPLTDTPEGLSFTIEFPKDKQTILIKGVIAPGKMDVDITT